MAKYVTTDNQSFDTQEEAVKHEQSINSAYWQDLSRTGRDVSNMGSSYQSAYNIAQGLVGGGSDTPVDGVKKTASNGFGTGVGIEGGETEIERMRRELYEQSQNTQSRDDIRSSMVERYQERINAINNMYAGLIAEERVAGEGRLGQTRAIGARSGLLGSPRGAAQKAKTEKYNADIIKGLENEKALKIQALFTEIDKLTDQRVKEETEAKRRGAEEWLTYLGSQADRKRENAGMVLDAMLSSGLEPADLSDEELTRIAGQLGMSPADVSTIIQGKYDEIARENEAAIAKGELDQYKALPADIKAYEYALANGFIPEGTSFFNYLKQEADATRAPKSPTRATESQIKRSTIAKLTEFLTTNAGGDNRVSPSNYNEAKSEWLEQGYSGADFDEIFARFVNRDHEEDYDISF